MLQRNRTRVPQRQLSKVRFPALEHMLETLKDGGDFMDQQVGTGKSDPWPQHQAQMLARMMPALISDRGIKVSLVSEDDLTGKRLATLIDPENVFVLGPLEHWVSAATWTRMGGTC
jgi:hypothetical protein